MGDKAATRRLEAMEHLRLAVETLKADRDSWPRWTLGSPPLDEQESYYREHVERAMALATDALVEAVNATHFWEE